MSEFEQILWGRRLRRCIYLISLPVSVTIIPSLLARDCGAYGIFAILIGFLLGALALHFGEKLIRPLWIRLGLSVFFLGTALLGCYFLTRYTQENLAKTISSGFILAILILFIILYVKNWKTSFEKCIYLTIWPVMLTILLTWLLIVGRVRINRVMDGFLQLSDFSFTGLWYGTALVFLTILCAICLPAALGRLNGASIKGMGLERTLICSGILQMISFFIYLGLFQVGALKTMSDPFQNLISMIRMPGGCFERQDALLCLGWFFSLFFYSVVSLWLSIGLLQKKTLLSLVLFCVCTGLTACGQPDIEKRAFPLTLAIAETKDGDEHKYIFDFENVNPSEQSLYYHEDEEITAGSYEEAYEKYKRTKAAELDDSHVVAILLEKELIDDAEFMDLLLSDFYENSHFSWNTAVFLYDSKETKLSDWRKKTGNRLGTYLSDRLEKQSRISTHAIATIGDLYLNSINQNEILYLPKLMDAKEPVVTGYYALGSIRN